MSDSANRDVVVFTEAIGDAWKFTTSSRRWDSRALISSAMTLGWWWPTP